MDKQAGLALVELHYLNWSALMLYFTVPYCSENKDYFAADKRSATVSVGVYLYVFCSTRFR